MTTPPRLTDPAARARARNRAARDPVLFLQERVADEIEERLEEVKRTFTAPAVVTAWPDLWRERLPAARIVAETDPLDMAPGAHDLVIHSLALHWAEDPVGQLVQCRHALQPDGLLIAAAFGGQTLHELRASLAEAEARATGGLSPRILPMGEIRDLGALLQRAGFALPVADSSRIDVSYGNALDLMRDLRGMGEGNALAARSRHLARRDVLLGASAVYEAAFGRDGRIPATFEVVFLTGWSPGPDQPQPLRPGSAKTRLADALRVPERPLGPTGD